MTKEEILAIPPSERVRIYRELAKTYSLTDFNLALEFDDLADVIEASKR